LSNGITRANLQVTLLGLGEKEKQPIGKEEQKSFLTIIIIIESKREKRGAHLLHLLHLLHFSVKWE